MSLRVLRYVKKFRECHSRNSCLPRLSSAKIFDNPISRLSFPIFRVSGLASMGQSHYFLNCALYCVAVISSVFLKTSQKYFDSLNPEARAILAIGRSVSVRSNLARFSLTLVISALVVCPMAFLKRRSKTLTERPDFCCTSRTEISRSAFSRM